MKPNYGVQRRLVKTAWAKWDRLLGITPGIQVTHLWNESCGDDLAVAARTNAQWEYRSAGLQWNLATLALLDDGEIEQVVVHEACHILLAPIESKLPDHYAELGEFTVEGLSRILLKLGDG